MKHCGSLLRTFGFLILGLSVWPHSAFAQGGGPVQTAGNEVRLTGSWKITATSGDGDDFWLIFDRPSGRQAFNEDEETIDFDIIENGEWTFVFELEDRPSDCNPGACDPAVIVSLQSVGNGAYEIWLLRPPANGDLLLRLEPLGSTPPTPGACRVETNSIGISQWMCGTQAVSQPFGGGLGSVTGFQIFGQTAVWRFSTGVPPGIVQAAWYANDITSGGVQTIRQLTHNTFGDVLGSGSIEGFFVTRTTAVWLFRTNVSIVNAVGQYAWYANDIRGGTYLSIRQITQRVFGGAPLPLGASVDAFYVTGDTAVWKYHDFLLTDAWFANDIVAGSTQTIRQITQDFEDFPAGQLLDVFFQTIRNHAVWQVGITTGIGGGTTRRSQWFGNCVDTGSPASIVPLTHQTSAATNTFFFGVVAGTAHWTECTSTGCVSGSTPLPSCGGYVATPSASIGSAGGTASGGSAGAQAQVQIPAGLLSTTADVIVDVLPEGSSFPPPLEFVWEDGTRLVDIDLQPPPTFPLASPGLTITLPLVNALPAGTPLALFVADPVTGHLVPKLNGAGEQIVGSVDSDGASATFQGIVSLSLFVGLRANAAPVADAGPDQVVECCGTAVTLDGSASTDPDGHELTFIWTGPFGTIDAALASVVLPLGSHTITLTIDDGHGGTSTDSLVATVGDAFGALVEGIAALPEAAFHKPQLREWLMGDLGGVSRTIAEGDLARAAIKLQQGIRIEISSWVTDYVPSSPSELTRSQLLSLCDRAAAGLLSQQ